MPGSSSEQSSLPTTINLLNEASLSLFERLRNLGRPNEVKLYMQYRMDPEISGTLEKVSGGWLQDADVRKTPRPTSRFVKRLNKELFQLDCAYGKAEVDQNGNSLIKPTTAKAVRRLVDFIVNKGAEYGTKASDMVVLAFYAAQKKLIEKLSAIWARFMMLTLLTMRPRY